MKNLCIQNTKIGLLRNVILFKYNKPQSTLPLCGYFDYLQVGDKYENQKTCRENY